MDSMEFNKIAAGVIGAGLLYLLLGFGSTAIYGTGDFAEHAVDGEHGPVLAYAVAIEDAQAGAAEEEPQIDLLALFQEADAGAGDRVFRACGACHALEPGVNRVGPSLHDIVGADIAAVDGFDYSDALAGMEGHWTPEALFGFLEDPQAFAPGTKMSYAGLDDPEDRADLIAYLNQSGDTPVDLTEGIEPLAPAEGQQDAAAEGQQMEVVESVAGPEGAGVVLEPTGEAEPELVPGVAGETSTRMPAGDAGVASEGAATAGQEPEAPQTGEGDGTVVTDIEVVDTEDEDVEVGSTTPLDIVEETGPDTVRRAEGENAARQQQGEAPAGAAQPTGQEAAQTAPAAGAGATAQPPASGGTVNEGATAQPPAGGGTEMVAGDPAAGERLFRRCAACHTLDEGVNRVGPSLYGIVGREVATVEGFNYSDALAAHGGVWTPERLAAFLQDPKSAVPGNRMAFPGLRNEQDLLDLIAYLQQAGG